MRLLLTDLERIFADAKATDAQRLSAANAFADYAAATSTNCRELLDVATPEQYAVLYPIVAASPSPATIEDLGKIAATLPPDALGSVERVPFGQRRANAAVTLLRLGEREKVLPVFDMTDDPEALTQFIFRCRPRGVGVEALLDCLQLVSDAPKDRYPRNTRYALLLALGEFTLEEIPESRRECTPRAARRLVSQRSQFGSARRGGLAVASVGPGGHRTRGGSNPGAVFARPRVVHAGHHGDPRSRIRQIECLVPRWRPKTFYYTFIVFPAGDYTIGSVDDEPDRDKGRDSPPGQADASLRAVGSGDHV